jgi:hypothetical protein
VGLMAGLAPGGEEVDDHDVPRDPGGVHEGTVDDVQLQGGAGVSDGGWAVGLLFSGLRPMGPREGHQKKGRQRG